MTSKEKFRLIKDMSYGSKLEFFMLPKNEQDRILREMKRLEE